MACVLLLLLLLLLQQVVGFITRYDLLPDVLASRFAAANPSSLSNSISSSTVTVAVVGTAGPGLITDGFPPPL